MIKMDSHWECNHQELLIYKITPRVFFMSVDL